MATERKRARTRRAKQAPDHAHERDVVTAEWPAVHLIPMAGPANDGSSSSRARRRAPPDDVELFYPEARRLLELAQGRDERALHDIELLGELAPRRRGRPARETQLRCDLQNGLGWFLQAGGDESFGELVSTCVECLPPGTEVDQCAIMLAAYRAQRRGAPTYDFDGNWIEGRDKRIDGRDIAWVTALFAIELNLLRDGEGNPSIATVARRYRKAQPFDRFETGVAEDELGDTGDEASGKK